jgi:site-specific DNA-methyltransferase (adenine-specific)
VDPLRVIVRADAFALPFADATFDVIVADPPYAGRNRGKKGMRAADSGYVPFRSYGWYEEAWRVLRPSGVLYVVCAVRELGDWLVGRPRPNDIVVWVSPNSPSLAAYWRRGIGGRASGWRPILMWQKEPVVSLKWPATEVIPGKGKKRNGEEKGRWVDPNFWIGATITSQMREAEAWPNQLPAELMRWLLRPHSGRVLDLFSGSGTTAVAAAAWGLECVSVDLSPEAIALQRARPRQLGLIREVVA